MIKVCSGIQDRNRNYSLNSQLFIRGSEQSRNRLHEGSKQSRNPLRVEFAGFRM
jgi:hypothetical protein